MFPLPDAWMSIKHSLMHNQTPNGKYVGIWPDITSWHFEPNISLIGWKLNTM